MTISPRLAATLLCLAFAGYSRSTLAQPAPSRGPDEPAAAAAHAGPGAGAGPAHAQPPPIAPADIAAPTIAESRRESRHAVAVDGRTLAYVATAGTLTLRDDDGKPVASMFYVGYTVPGASRRPVTFLYNGGPGSSSVWLHMGSIGPMRVRTDAPAASRNAPFDFAPNPHTLLDKTDLVFLDAIGAGFSRPLGQTKLAQFWGTDADIDAFARGIERYLTINDRWNSPKFIFGESYGTTRSAGLAYRLQRDGVQLNGVVLLSSILNYGRRDPGFDREMVNYLPSYAAIAAWHRRLPRAVDDPTPCCARRAPGRAAPMPWRWRSADDLSAAENDRDRRQDGGATPAFRRASSSTTTCASIPPASARNCCATSA